MIKWEIVENARMFQLELGSFLNREGQVPFKKKKNQNP